jgi:hypothetical protein
VVALVGLGTCDDATVALDLDGRVPEGLGARADRLGAWGGRDLRELLVVRDPPLAVRRVPAAEVEAAPRDQGLVVAEAGEVQERLEVDVGIGHGQLSPRSYPIPPTPRASAPRSQRRRPWPIGEVRALTTSWEG